MRFPRLPSVIPTFLINSGILVPEFVPTTRRTASLVVLGTMLTTVLILRGRSGAFEKWIAEIVDDERSNPVSYLGLQRLGKKISGLQRYITLNPTALKSGDGRGYENT